MDLRAAATEIRGDVVLCKRLQHAHLGSAQAGAATHHEGDGFGEVRGDDLGIRGHGSPAESLDSPALLERSVSRDSGSAR